MLVRPENLLAHLEHLKLVPPTIDKMEVRVYAFVVAALLFYNLIEPATYAVFIQESLTYRVAHMTHSGMLLGLGFYLAAVMMLPHLWTLAFSPQTLDGRLPRKLAAFAGCLGGILWGLLAYVAAPLDAEWLVTVFAIRCAVDFLIAGIFALSLNRQTIMDVCQNGNYCNVAEAKTPSN